MVGNSAGLRRIAGLLRRAIPRPAEFPIARLTQDEAIAGIAAVLREDAAGDRFSGAVLVANNGQLLFSRAYGLADRERGIPNTVQTRFRIGSMNKMFTAVATLQLAEAGQIELTAPLGEYLTGYPNRDVAAKVTIHHLLTHTAARATSLAPSSRRTARSFARSVTTCSCTATGGRSSSRGAAGGTAITASSCSAP
jgi:CubicO group peptidase (beta-lactamase class C family)